METYPLPSIGLAQAKALQFIAIDCITRHFDGFEVLACGDLGVKQGLGKPATTEKAEAVFADVFGAEAALLVRGAGTGAIRWGLMSFMKPGEKLLVHAAPVYPTTKVTVEGMGLELVEADFNDLDDISRVMQAHGEALKGALVQHTRQKPDDRYSLGAVIGRIKALNPALPVLTDDNYAALKVPQLGNQAGADIATFSCFKILGPHGVGVMLGRRALIEKAAAYQYSGGSQVQGFEAMEALRGLVYAPVSLAVQAEVGDEIVARLNAGEVRGVKGAFTANAQSKVVLAELSQPVAKRLLEITPTLGAAAHPVGSESIYELVPMMYRVSGTFLAHDPALADRMIRINPMRSGADTVLRILRQALEQLNTCQG